MTLDIAEIEDSNLHGPESNIDYINRGGECEIVCLNQVRDQILPGLITGRNLARENINNNVGGVVNN